MIIIIDVQIYASIISDMIHKALMNIWSFFKLVLFLLIVIIPGFLHMILSFFLMPVGAFLSVLMGRQIGFQSGQLAVKVGIIALVVVLPAVFYFHVSAPLGIAFFVCMLLYLLVRIYSRSLPKDNAETGRPKELDRLIEKYKSEQIKYNPAITVITVVLNITGMFIGYLVGDEKGLWIGLTITVILSSLSPFAEKTQDSN